MTAVQAKTAQTIPVAPKVQRSSSPRWLVIDPVQRSEGAKHMKGGEKISTPTL